MIELFLTVSLLDGALEASPEVDNGIDDADDCELDLLVGLFTLLLFELILQAKFEIRWCCC